eukprot:4242885-Amphidinium_carterae.1
MLVLQQYRLHRKLVGRSSDEEHSLHNDEVVSSCTSASQKHPPFLKHTGDSDVHFHRILMQSVKKLWGNI